MFGRVLRARFQLPGLSVAYPPAYSPFHCLCSVFIFPQFSAKKRRCQCAIFAREKAAKADDFGRFYKNQSNPDRGFPRFPFTRLVRLSSLTDR